MKFTSKSLKNYVTKRAHETSLQRAKYVHISRLEIAEDKNSAKARVMGSKGRNFYDVHFRDINNSKILGSCSCPYDWGGICKHQVAVAIELDKKLNQKLNQKPAEKKVVEVKKEVVFSCIRDENGSIKSNTIGTIESYYSWLSWARILDVGVRDDDKIIFVTNAFFHGPEITVTKHSDRIDFECDCRGQKYGPLLLCEHLAGAVMLLHNQYNDFYLTESAMNAIKNKALKKYGFSLDDDIYKEYFDFIPAPEGFILQPLKKGIVRLSKYEDYKGVVENMLENEESLAPDLPFLSKPPKNKKKKGIALLMSFGKDEYELENDFEDEDKYSLLQRTKVWPLVGNISKDSNLLASKIEFIKPETIIHNDYQLSEQELEVVREALELSPDRINYLKKNKYRYADANHMLKYVLDKYKSLIKKAEGLPVYISKYDNSISKNDLKLIQLSTEETSLSFKVVEEDILYVLKAYIQINGRKNQLTPKHTADNFFFVNQKDTYYLNKSIAYANALDFFSYNSEMRFRKDDYDQYYEKYILPLSKKYEVTVEHKKIKNKKIDPSEIQKQVYLSSINEHIIFRPMLEYNGMQIEVMSPDKFRFSDNVSEYAVARNPEADEEFLQVVKNLHESFQEQDQAFFYLSTEDFLEKVWFIDAIDQLEQQNIQVFGFNDLKGIKYNKNKPTISVNINSGTDWFDVEVNVSFGNELVTLKDLRKAVINKSRYVELKNKSLGILPEKWLDKYAHLFRQGEVQKDKISVSKYQLSVIDSLYEEIDLESDFMKNHLSIKQKLKNFNQIDNVKIPKGIKAELRDYQKEGLNYLNFLDEHEFGGCLADDMGLGKTLQIITFFQHLKNKKSSKNANLVVVPTSLIFNWQEEIRKFCPSLKVFILFGVDRQRSTEDFDQYDLVIITYGTIIRDIEYLKEYRFHYVVLDESQAIKNPLSKRYKAVRLLQSDNKLVLTGTPIENNTFDLYSQMTFVNPGILGNMSNFKTEYATKIDRDKDPQAAEELRNIISPFLLRRTKEQVATELPPKTEQTLYCTMTDEQQKLYDAYKNKYRDYILGKIEDEGLNNAKMYVLEGLTKLRQICDSPSLINDDEIYTDESIKIKELIKHITEKTGNHKILVFSSFVKMLRLIEKELNKVEVSYEYLDGKTKNRKAKVEKFQNDEQVRVFLISLKAGGTGLNLTAADYVYLVDPWWNPAVEAQAIDRCYRIGQTKNVMAYKMICKDTIEEKIVVHQENKKQTSADIIQTDESYVKQLSRDNVVDLFS